MAVDLTVEPAGQRYDATVESTAYFLVAEALTNVPKYAGVDRATVTVRRRGSTLEVEVRDRGVGGAAMERGSGLRGLVDRLAAVDATLELDSPPGGGTTLRASIPLAGARTVDESGSARYPDAPTPGTMGA
jgi:signal transduction histidine kinase